MRRGYCSQLKARSQADVSCNQDHKFSDVAELKEGKKKTRM